MSARCFVKLSTRSSTAVSLSSSWITGTLKGMLPLLLAGAEPDSMVELAAANTDRCRLGSEVCLPASLRSVVEHCMASPLMQAATRRVAVELCRGQGGHFFEAADDKLRVSSSARIGY